MLYDVIVIGGGAGGVPAAIRASQLGARVALIECGDLGGLCMNRGCIPFGQMMAASHMLGIIDLGKEMGLEFSGVSKNYAVLKKRQDELVAFMGQGVKGTLKKNKVDLMMGRGKIIGPGAVRVENDTISANTIILATGAKWWKPDFPGADLEEVINSDNLIESEKLPKRVLLFGKGSWMIQIAQFLRRFGSEVILVTEEKTILPDESRTITSRLRKALKKEGIGIKTKGRITAATREKDGLHVDYRSKEGHETGIVDRILTIERRADLKGLGLKVIGLDEDGAYLHVSDKMETGVRGVYAIGDLTGPPPEHFSHLASLKGVIAAENAMGGDAAMNPKTVTRVLFTDPQVACVGLTPKEAQNAGYDVMVGNVPFVMNPFGMIMSENEGMVEVVAERRYGELLGVHLIGKNAAEMVGQAVLAIQMEATVEELSRVPFPHPTLSESLVEAARDALGNPIYLP